MNMMSTVIMAICRLCSIIRCLNTTDT